MYGFPNRERLERIRSSYPKGTRIELIDMADPYSAPEPGTIGTVAGVDDAGNIMMDWDTGSHLSLIPGVDSFRVVTK